MNMMESTLKKLNERQLSYCRIVSGTLVKATEKGLKDLREHEAGKLRGYLECMEDMGIISKLELKQLYVYFFTGE